MSWDSALTGDIRPYLWCLRVKYLCQTRHTCLTYYVVSPPISNSSPGDSATVTHGPELVPNWSTSSGPVRTDPKPPEALRASRKFRGQCRRGAPHSSAAAPNTPSACAADSGQPGKVVRWAGWTRGRREASSESGAGC